MAKFESAVVAFVDILGYRDIIISSIQNGTAENEVDKLRSALDKALEYIKISSKAESKWRSWRYQIFSDSFIMTYSGLRYEDAEVELWTISNFLAQYQAEMILHGYFVRGAISIGDISSDEEIIFGQPLLDAYDGERLVAGVPRIILTDSARDRLKQQFTLYRSVDESPQNDMFLSDADNQVFLDYLEERVNIAVDEIGHDFDYLTKHRDMVLTKLDENRSNPKIWGKYHWVARYHNFFCRAYPNSIGSSFLIDIPANEPSPMKLSEYHL